MHNGKGVPLSRLTSEIHVPCCYCSLRRAGTHGRPLAISQRKAWATVGPYAPNPLGYTRRTMRATKGCDPERGSKSPKSTPSSDRGLELALVKLESLVGERHHATRSRGWRCFLLREFVRRIRPCSLHTPPVKPIE